MTTATFTIDVEFDSEVTDAESIANALDILLTTALSTPEIVEEYGDPQFSGFEVLETPKGFDDKGSTCPKCGKSYEAGDIDGGRCLGCGATISDLKEQGV